MATAGTTPPASRRRRGRAPAQLLVSALLAAGAVAFLPPAVPQSQRYHNPQSAASGPAVAGAARRVHGRLGLWRGWGMGGSGGNNGTAASGGEGEDEIAAAAAAAMTPEELEMERLAASLLPEIVADDEDENGNGAAPVGVGVGDSSSPGAGARGGSSGSSSSSMPPAVLTERALQQLDDSSSFDGFEGFRGRKVSYSSQPKARSNILFEIWRQRTPEDIAILYKGQHQYSASRRVQDAINEQVSTLLGMFLREPDFQSRLQIQGGQLANLFFKLQMLGYLFANADRVLSASSALNLREAPRRPPVGKVEGTVAVSMGEGRGNVTVQARDLLGNLVREVEALREELDRAKLNREVSRQSDLIAFIRALPEEEQRALTENAPDYTLDCMRKLVDLALARAIPTVGNQWNPTTPVLIPSKAIFAELCIMQVVTGYLLRATEEDQAQQLKVFGGLGFP